MVIKKINPGSKANPDTGFGNLAANIGGRFVNKDGSANLRKTGWPLMKRLSVYSYLLNLSWTSFLLIIMLIYMLVNLLFTGIYWLVGLDELQGFTSHTEWGKIKEVFYFSTQSFTTVGYGRINPVHDGSNLVATIETMLGWLFFALVTGLLYGRFTRPRAYIAFSENTLISPYNDGIALMFRMVPFKNSHNLIDTRVAVNLTLVITENDKPSYQFYQLNLERSRIDTFTMNWTVVHPINEESPLLNLTKEDLENSGFELLVQVTGFDPIYSSNVTQRTSYTSDEVVWGAKFKSMYRESEDGNTTILELNKLGEYDIVELNVLV